MSDNICNIFLYFILRGDSGLGAEGGFARVIAPAGPSTVDADIALRAGRMLSIENPDVSRDIGPPSRPGDPSCDLDSPFRGHCGGSGKAPSPDGACSYCGDRRGKGRPRELPHANNVESAIPQHLTAQGRVSRAISAGRPRR